MHSKVDNLPEGAVRVLDDGFIRLVKCMASDADIVQAARVSYGAGTKKVSEDRGLIRYLMRHWHTTPFEMCEFKFHIRVPMDCWRQWIRHRTANVNEYSTRYSLAIDSKQTTQHDQWRLQSKNNKQGSGQYISSWEDCPDYEVGKFVQTTVEFDTPGKHLSDQEQLLHTVAWQVYCDRLQAGVAREQARKDLPLSTYTEAYWKCDLHNIFHFLRLRLHTHAQYEIRQYAQAMYELIKPHVPLACEAFEDYRLNAEQFSAQELAVIKELIAQGSIDDLEDITTGQFEDTKLSKRELREFKQKLGIK